MFAFPKANSDSATHAPPQPRCRIPSVIIAMLATLGLGIAAVALSIWVSYRREQQLIQRIEEWGVGQYVTEAGEPEWLRELLGEDRKSWDVLARVKGVIFEGSRFDDGKLAYLSQWTNIERLSLVGTGITDAGMRQMKHFRNLRSVNIAGTAVTDKGLAQLSGCKNLSALNLFNLEGVTDASVVLLSEMENLKYLELRHTAVTHNGVQALRRALPDCDIRY